MAFTPLKRQALDLHLKGWCVWGMCSIWAHVYSLARRSHMKHACALSIICLLRVCLYGKTVWILCMCCSSGSVHLFSSDLYIYIQDHVSVSAVREYRSAFCIWLTGVTPNCTPHQLFRTCVQDLVRVSTLIWTFLKVHIACIQVFLSLRDHQYRGYRSVAMCVCAPTCACCCVSKAIITLQVHHIPTVWLKVVSVPFQSIPFIL